MGLPSSWTAMTVDGPGDNRAEEVTKPVPARPDYAGGHRVEDTRTAIDPRSLGPLVTTDPGSKAVIRVIDADDSSEGEGSEPNSTFGATRWKSRTEGTSEGDIHGDMKLTNESDSGDMLWTGDTRHGKDETEGPGRVTQDGALGWDSGTRGGVKGWGSGRTSLEFNGTGATYDSKEMKPDKDADGERKLDVEQDYAPGEGGVSFARPGMDSVGPEEGDTRPEADDARLKEERQGLLGPLGTTYPGHKPVMRVIDADGGSEDDSSGSGPTRKVFGIDAIPARRVIGGGGRTGNSEGERLERLGPCEPDLGLELAWRMVTAVGPQVCEEGCQGHATSDLENDVPGEISKAVTAGQGALAHTGRDTGAVPKTKKGGESGIKPQKSGEPGRDRRLNHDFEKGGAGSKKRREKHGQTGAAIPATVNQPEEEPTAAHKVSTSTELGCDESVKRKSTGPPKPVPARPHTDDGPEGPGNVCIGGLDGTTNSEALSSAFSVFGRVIRCKVPMDRDGGNKKYGFLQFDSKEAAVRSLDGVALNGTTVYGKLYSPGKRPNIKVKPRVTTQASSMTKKTKPMTMRDESDRGAAAKTVEEPGSVREAAQDTRQANELTYRQVAVIESGAESSIIVTFGRAWYVGFNEELGFCEILHEDGSTRFNSGCMQHAPCKRRIMREMEQLGLVREVGEAANDEYGGGKDSRDPTRRK